MANEKQFVPALRFHWATGIYDPIMKLLVRDKELRKRTLQEISPLKAKRVVELGCGTGSLSHAINSEGATGEVIGVDLDPKALEIAARKQHSNRFHPKPTFYVGDITAPDLGADIKVDACDLVICSLVLHHLSENGKERAISNASKLLRSSGNFVVIDWGPGANIVYQAAFNLVRVLDGFEETAANTEGRIPDFIERGGFEITTSRPILNTAFGTIWVCDGRKS